MKTIYYYQTFVGLHKLLTHLTDIDVINVSSIHFNQSKDGSKNIYLNDNLPTAPIFDQMWMEVHKAYSEGVTIMLMVGGAGGAYTNLFSDFETYYPMLRELLQQKTFISGIDIDIEEFVKLSDVKKFINQLKEDFPDIKLSMAPVATSMMGNYPGMGNFSYKELYHSPEGQCIDWFNVQCYDSFSVETYTNIVNNGYPPEKIVMGMESGQFDKTNFQRALDIVKHLLETYPKMGGVYDWEYLNAPPDDNDCSAWCKLMKNVDQVYFDSCGAIILE